MRDELLFGSILSQPSAPFREHYVRAVLLEALSAAKVPCFFDPVGNLVVGASSQKDYLRRIRSTSAKNAKSEPVRLFIAHMDHPGFHAEEWKSETDLAVRWYGGTPLKHLEGASVWLARQGARSGAEAWAPSATVQSATLHPSGRMIASAILRCSPETRKTYPDAKKLFGGFGFRAPQWREEEIVYTKAADDLVGCFAIASLAIELWKKRNANPAFIGLLTRAEEVGFVGAVGHLELGWLAQSRREILAISLETSRTLPGAEVGKGPVVRLGDRATVFHAGALRLFTDLATQVLPEKHQRRIMDGGSCEGTAMTAYGLPSIGISVPLGNYHNQNFEGGPDSRGKPGDEGPAPEFVHRGDVEGLQELCRALMRPKLPWSDTWAAKRKEMKKNLHSYRALLRGEA